MIHYENNIHVVIHTLENYGYSPRAMLGHSLIQTTKDHYAIPSVEQMRVIMERGSNAEPEEDPLWSDDEDELARLCGLR